MHNVISNNLKINYLVHILDTEVADKVIDVIKRNVESDKYSKIKAAVITRMTDFNEKQLHELLTGITHGSDKPLKLWRKMKGFVL